jgi:hypothetical protein
MSRFVPKIAPREFTTVRTFAAPRDLVFEEWIDPVRISAWFGPRGFSPGPPGWIREGPRSGLRVGSSVGARAVRRCARRFHCGDVDQVPADGRGRRLGQADADDARGGAGQVE